MDVIQRKRAGRRLVSKTTHEAQEHKALVGTVGRQCILKTLLWLYQDSSGATPARGTNAPKETNETSIEW